MRKFGSGRKQFFIRSLMEWGRDCNTREMPWKNEKDPYKVWISEIILQQTRVAQGEAYYHRFIKAFPTISALATASEEKIYKYWEGLGYYTRCKNLILSAKYVENNYRGKFPATYEQIRELRGVGDYTAAAIASFAFGLPHAVVDGNVSRVLARFFGIKEEINSTEGKKLFSTLAHELLDRNDPAFYNQSIMDLGAVVCKPKKPECPICPLRKKCVAYKENLQGALPVKKKAAACRQRYFTYLLVENGKGCYFRKRGGKDIWENLYEPFLIESDKLPGEAELKEHPKLKSLLDKIPFQMQPISEKYSQKLTHQLIHAQFVEIRIRQKLKEPGMVFIARGADHPAFPKIIVRYLKDKKVSLNLGTK